MCCATLGCSSGIINGCRFMPRDEDSMRVCICCCVALLMMAGSQPQLSSAHRCRVDNPKRRSRMRRHPSPLSSDDKANELSEQVGKLMVKCVNLLTAQDPLSLDCLQTAARSSRSISSPQQRLVDKMLAHDEYGIALAAFGTIRRRRWKSSIRVSRWCPKR